MHAKIVVLSLTILLGLWLIKQFVDKIANSVRRRKHYPKLKHSELRTGDILLFQGRKPLNGYTITKLATDSFIHHCGMIYVDDRTGIPYVWDSLFHGYSFVYLQYLLDNRSQECHYYIARWNKPIDNRKVYEVMDIQSSMESKYNYDTPTLWIKHKLGLPNHVKRKTCSHLLAETYKMLGMIKNEDLSFIYPGHFTPYSEALEFDNGYALLPTLYRISGKKSSLVIGSS